MKVVILAGGYGTRFGKLTEYLPKPMINIGPMPIIWHIMKNYMQYDHREFIICTGYKSDLIKNFFLNLDSAANDFTIDFQAKSSARIYHRKGDEFDAKVTICYTGQNTMTGGRLHRVKHHLKEDNDFLLTYGDGLSDVPIDDLIHFHHSHNKIATLTAVYPPPKFGTLAFDGDCVTSFTEKSGQQGSLVNGGFYVFKREFLDLLDNNSECVLEKKPLESVASDGQLMAYKHRGFWQCMDTSRDLETLQELWSTGSAPWKNWAKDGYID